MYHAVTINHCFLHPITKAELQMAEAVGLVQTLQNWTVVDKVIMSTKTPEKRRIFGKGNFQTLTGLLCLKCFEFHSFSILLFKINKYESVFHSGDNIGAFLHRKN